LKQEKQVVKRLNLMPAEELAKILDIRGFKANREKGIRYILRKEPTTKKPV
jgi:predicted RNA binding protein YcfA (HicA-like mRNA interferase family)